MEELGPPVECQIEVVLFTGGLTLWQKLKAAFHILTRQQMYLSECIILGPDDSQELLRELGVVAHG